MTNNTKTKSSVLEDVLLCYISLLVGGLLVHEGEKFQQMIRMPDGRLFLLIDILRMFWFVFMIGLWLIVSFQNGRKRRFHFLIPALAIWPILLGAQMLASHLPMGWSTAVADVANTFLCLPFAAYPFYFTNAPIWPEQVYAFVLAALVMITFCLGFFSHRLDAHITRLLTRLPFIGAKKSSRV